MNIIKIKNIIFFLFFFSLLTHSTFAGEATGNVSTGAQTSTSGTVVNYPSTSPNAGSYNTAQTVSIISNGAPYTCYTLDGSAPSCLWETLECSTGTKYSSAISISSSTTIKAVGCFSAENSSAVASYGFTIGSSGSGGGGGGGYTPTPVEVQISNTSNATDEANEGSSSEEDSDNQNESTPTCDNGIFNDTKTHWSKEFVEILKCHSIVNGKTKTLFKPDDSITRAEATKITLLVFKKTTEETFTPDFSDISKDDWYWNVVLSAKKQGIVKGKNDGKFYPNSSITRAEAIKILLEASGKTVIDTESIFEDVNDGDWFKKYVTFGAKEGIIKGKNDGKFYPNKAITRGEFSKIAVLIAELTKP